MSTFTALNVEPESDNEDEIDNSKEIQIEEALKLYQNALKLHSQGPPYYDEAERAYNALFRSEVFTYLESLSEAQLVDIYGEDPDTLISSNDNIPIEPLGAAPNADGSPSTLPQILYLSYKNYGQFVLDRLKQRILETHSQDSSTTENANGSQPTSRVIASSLELLVEALDRDDTDMELWRQLSRIGDSLGSKRIARFCLEAVVNRDDLSLDVRPEPLGLQEIFAMEMLRNLLHLLDDDAVASSMAPLTRKQRKLVQSFEAHLDPLPFLPTPPPDPLNVSFSADQTKPNAADAHRIAVPLRTWASCGKAILSQIQNEVQGLVNTGPGTSYSLLLPPSHASIDPKQTRNKNVKEPDDNGQPTTVSNVATFDAGSNGNMSSLPTDSNLERKQVGSQEAGNKSKAQSKAPSESEVAEVPGDADLLVGKVNESDQSAAPAATGKRNTQDADPKQDEARTMTLPTRKRSTEAAELDDGEDTGRSKSKRIKARASIEEPGPRKDPLAKQLEQWQQSELRYLDHIDEQALEHSAAILSIFGVAAVGSAKKPKADVLSLVGPQAERNTDTAKMSQKDCNTLTRDLAVSLANWNTQMSNVFLHGTGFEDPISGAGATRHSGLLVFLEQSAVRPRDGPSKPLLTDDRGLEAFVDHLEQDWVPLDQLALAWVRTLLARESYIQFARDSQVSTAPTTYEAFLWPDNLKETVVQLLVKEDEIIFATLSDETLSLDGSRSHILAVSKHPAYRSVEMIQTIFELHLDIYGRITNPSSEVDMATRTAQRDRLQRWASLAHQALNWEEETNVDSDCLDQLSIRFLWAYAVLADLCGMCSRDLVILYFQDLRLELKNFGSPVIELHNNAIMPEISIEAAEKQISRLTTMDFFINVFSPEKDDPIALIESLEPILEKSIKSNQFSLLTRSQTSKSVTNADPAEDPDAWQANNITPDTTEAQTDQMLQFLDRANLSMQLLLWRRLIDAYSVIQYPPRILLCYLRCIGLITSYLQSPEYLDQGDEMRQNIVLRWLRSLDDLLRWTLALALTDTKSLDCMDEANLRDAMSDLAALQHILHSFVAWDDLVRTAMRDAPKQPNNPATTAHSNAMDKFRDMVVKAWTLQYVLIRECAAQTSNHRVAMDRDLVQYLKSTHKALGSRNYCKLSNKVLVRLTKQEISRIGDFADSEVEAAQLILDLYGLKICPGSKEIDDHGCPAETLERVNAVEIMDRVLVQANRLNIKDLNKSELRSAIEKMQQVIKEPKTTPSVKRNRDTLEGYLMSPVNPLHLYRALRGIGELPYQKLRGETFQIAEKGWYFLQGYMALSRFRFLKKTVPGQTSDLNAAMSFLRFDLEQGFEKWETWYRLAQVYDAKIEEETTWTADKLNDGMDELINLQRNAIHCYSMAVATAERCEEPSFDMFQKVADLYSDFGIRVYGSSREPFSMEAFSVEKFTKHFNGGRHMYLGQPFTPVSLYACWRFASTLLRRALVHKPDNWVTWYMLGKCLWKMHNCDDHVLSGNTRDAYQPVIEAFKLAIKHLPGQRDNKHPEKDPILEPHYKLASIVHKLVSSGRLGVEAGCDILSATPYARRVPSVQDLDDWEGYVLHILKVLRSADKANWHHRMVLRSARTIYEGSPNDHMATLGAKSELTQQIFTKTMTVQVWKPEHERTGRHFVYTQRYVRFFLRLLFELKDRAGIEALGRQIRKKPGKFFKHGQLWHETCMTHLTLLRTQCLLPTELSDSIFKNISHDLFVQNADRLETWAHLPSTEMQILDILKEAIELKKTNANLMKPAVIEDFIADIYAHLHQTIVPELIARSNEEESRGRMRVDHLMNVEKTATSTPSPDPAVKTEDAAPPRQRIRGVGRREIQKRAEALVNKPAAAQISAKAPKTPPPTNEPVTPRSTIQVVIKRNEPSRENSSVRGSVHDSADDESDLSDIEDNSETTGAKQIFPNLADSKETADDEREEEEEAEEGEGEGEQNSGTFEDDQAEDVPAEVEVLEEDDQCAAEGEETYHTPMEM
ncbi:MAG: hypothetical protein Q9181_004067 [Wetmoreana brouardii]